MFKSFSIFIQSNGSYFQALKKKRYLMSEYSPSLSPINSVSNFEGTEYNEEEI